MHQNFSAYSQHWSTERAQFSVLQLHVVQPTLQKLDELGCKILPHPLYLPDLLPTEYRFFKRLDKFCWEITSQPTGGRKNFQEYAKS